MLQTTRVAFSKSALDVMVMPAALWRNKWV